MSTVADTMDFTYTFPSGSNNGNVQKITNNIDWHRTQSFTYDSLNRISTAQTNADNQPAFQGDNSLQMCWAETFTYDPWGNLLTLGANTTTQSNYTGCTQESGFNYTGSIATNNRLAVSGFSYDAAGNMTASPGATYTYDAENHLITTHGVTYAYDGDGKRLTKSSGMMYWYGLNSDPLIETDLSNNLKAHYIFFNGQRVASENSSNSVDWYFADHLGTARLVFSLNGDDQSDFYPFGGERVITTGAGNHYKFTGKERDSESNLDNFGARYNSSTMGRWMSPDKPFADQHPINPQSWNLFVYTLNNPLRFIDDDGLEVKETRTVTHYTVSGATADEALANANSHSFGSSGDHAGLTTPTMTWHTDTSYSSQTTSGSVTVTTTVTSDTITLDQNVQLPHWDGYSKASPEDQKTWDEAVDKLQGHETDHEDINRAAADALDKSLPGTTSTATGKSLDPTVKASQNNNDAAVQNKVDASNQSRDQKNNQLDACTNHGTHPCK